MFRSSKISRLAELLDDPIVYYVMKSDGVDRRSLDLLFDSMRNARRREPARSENSHLAPIAC